MGATHRLAEREERGPAPDPAARADKAPPRDAGRRSTVILASLAAVVLVALGGYALLTRAQETTDNAQVEADVVPLNVRVGGQVLRVDVQDNARVRKGDPLVELDPREYESRVEQAGAELDSAREQAAAAEAEATVVEAGARGGHVSARAVVSASAAAVSSAEAQVNVARAALSRAEADAHRTALDLERAQRLRPQGIVSQKELDDARSAHEASQAALAGARAQLAAAEQSRQVALERVAEARGQLDQSAPVEAKIAAARASAALARARVKSAGAALEQARLQLEYTRLVAPADGWVSRLTVREGQLLSAGQPVAQLVPARTYVIANFKETQVGRIRPGQRAEVRVDTFPGLKLPGRVESLAGGTGARFALLPPDNASGNFVKVVQRVPVRIAWEAPPPGDLPLYAGLSAEVTIFTTDPPPSTPSASRSRP